LLLIETMPGVQVRDVVEATDAELKIAESLR
jgi:acyl CoA:acetate/3-ketoacid CoA transferase beta subunit